MEVRQAIHSEHAKTLDTEAYAASSSSKASLLPMKSP